MTYTCKKCGETKTEKIDPTGKHTYEWTVTKPATCTEKGVESGKCSVCGHTTTRDIPAMGHKGGKIVHENNPDQHWFDKCDNCGKPYGHENHSYKGSWIVGEAATETEDGWKYKDCEVCGYRATKKIPAGMDHVAETGDITGQFVMGATAVIVMLFAAVAFVFKRKTAK